MQQAYLDQLNHNTEEQLSIQKQQGQIATQNAKDMGAALNEGVKGAVSSYYEGKKRRQDEKESGAKLALSEEEIQKAKYGNAALKADQDIMAEEGADHETYRHKMARLKGEKESAEIGKLNREGGPKEESAWEKTGEQDSAGHPISFNKKTNKYMVDTGVTLKPKDAKEPPKVTSATASQIGGYDASLNMADQLEGQYNDLASGRFSGVKSLFPSTDADKYNKVRDYAAQTIGSNLEGGKLSDKDYDRYRTMMPAPGDSNSIAKQKMLTLKNMILAKKRGEVGGLSGAGFDTSGFPETPGAATTRIDGGIPDNIAIAAPQRKKANEMTDEELDAELLRLKAK